MIETIAIWWLYLCAGTGLLGIYGALFIWSADKLIDAFKAKRLFLFWYADHLRAKKAKKGGDVFVPASKEDPQ